MADRWEAVRVETSSNFFFSKKEAKDYMRAMKENGWKVELVKGQECGYDVLVHIPYGPLGDVIYYEVKGYKAPIWLE